MADDMPEQDMMCNATIAYTRVHMFLLISWVWRILRVVIKLSLGAYVWNPRTQKSEGVKL